MQLLHPLQVPYGMRCVVVVVVVVVANGVATLTVGLLCCGVRPKFDTLTKDCRSDASTFQSTTITTQETPHRKHHTPVVAFLQPSISKELYIGIYVRKCSAIPTGNSLLKG